MNTDNSVNNMCYSTSGNSICVEAKGGICTPMVHMRTALVEDAKELLSIYAPYVRNTAITFEYDVPSLEEFQGRIEATLKKYPYIVALYNERIVVLREESSGMRMLECFMKEKPMTDV